MIIRRLLMAGICCVMLVLSSFGLVKGAAVQITDFRYVTPEGNEPGCYGSFIILHYDAVFETADYEGRDFTAGLVYDSAGELIALEITSKYPDDSILSGIAFAPYALNPIPPGDINVVLYDILPVTPFGPVSGGSWVDWIIANSVVVDTATASEPEGGWPQCGVLSPVGLPFNPQDGRLNPDAGATAAFYAPPDGSLQVYGVDAQSHGYPAIYVSPEEVAALPAAPEANLKIAESDDGKIALYKLTTGEYQLNVGPDFEGKVFVYIFAGDPLALVKSYTE